MFNFQPDVSQVHFDNRYNQVWEASKLIGRPCYYYQPEEVRRDDVFKEIESRKFDNSKKYDFFFTRDNETMFNGTESFGGFGYLPSYADIFYIPKKWFDDVIITPLEGDLIYDITNEMIFEVTKVNENVSEWNGDVIGGRVFNNKLYLKLYEAGYNDDISTLTEFSDIDLENLNGDLTGVLDTLNTNVTISVDNPFGELLK